MLQDSLERQGDFLFRWRGYLPLLGVPILAWELWRFSYPFGSPRYDAWVEIASFAIASVGIAIRALVQGYAPTRTSGRNTREQKAAELNTLGMYSLCRHPLYLGNFVICIGVLSFFASPGLLVVFSLLFCLYYERIMLREEAFLDDCFGERFRSWAARTPTFLPRLWAWQQPDVPFRWRRVLRREYTTLFSVVLVMTCFEVLGDLAIYDRLRVGPIWLAGLLLASLQYLVLRFLKKRTALLRA